MWVNCRKLKNRQKYGARQKVAKSALIYFGSCRAGNLCGFSFWDETRGKTAT